MWYEIIPIVRVWYDGYMINGRHMYNPNSVCNAMLKHSLKSFWKNTSSFDAINSFIQLDYHGLKEDVIRMLAGEKADVDVETFRNDLSDIRSKDDVLTALIHLGYLAYDENEQAAYLPNYEVRKAFQAALKDSSWTRISDSISRSDELLKATLRKEEAQVGQEDPKT